MMDVNAPGFLNGVYSYREAARLLGVASRRISRWADGYTFQLKGGRGESKPILQTERHTGVLTFYERWELMFVKEYVGLNVPLPKIRETAEVLAARVGEYPFSRSNLLVHGRHLLVEVADGVLERADIGQLVADYAAELAQHVEIRENLVGRYAIPEYNQLIYIDKDRRGGEPVVSDRAIPTRLIFDLWKKEQQVASVAEYYDLATEVVSAAIRYEGQWRIAA